MAGFALAVAAVVQLLESVAHIIAQDNETPAIFGDSDVAGDALPGRRRFSDLGWCLAEGSEDHGFEACDRCRPGRGPAHTTSLGRSQFLTDELTVARKSGAEQGNWLEHAVRDVNPVLPFPYDSLEGGLTHSARNPQNQ